MELIPKELAAAQEIQVRKKHSLNLIAIAAALIVTLAVSYFGYLPQALILLLMFIGYLHIENHKETHRLAVTYGIK